MRPVISKREVVSTFRGEVGGACLPCLVKFPKVVGKYRLLFVLFQESISFPQAVVLSQDPLKQLRRQKNKEKQPISFVSRHWGNKDEAVRVP